MGMGNVLGVLAATWATDGKTACDHSKCLHPEPVLCPPVLRPRFIINTKDNALNRLEANAKEAQEVMKKLEVCVGITSIMPGGGGANA